MNATTLDYLIFDKIYIYLRRSSVLKCHIVSDSMSPIIKEGDIIEIAPIPKNLVPFQIIVFRSHFHQKIFCHMVWRVPVPLGKKIYITRGIANNFEDREVYEDDVLGIVTNVKVSRYWKLKLMLLSLLRK